MKILYDHQIFTYQQAGGISRYYYELLKYIRHSKEINCDLSLTYFKNYYLSEMFGFKTHRIGFWGPDLLKTFFEYQLNKLTSINFLTKGDYHLFHPTFYDPYFYRYNKKDFVLTIFDMIPELFPETFNPHSLYYRLVTKKWIESKKLLAEKAKKIIAISENTKKDIVRLYGINENKIEVIYLAQSLKVNKPSEEAGDDARFRYLLYVGLRNGYKNYRRLFEALLPVLKANDDLKLVCCGGGPFTAEEKIQISDNRLASRILQKNVSDAQLVAEYKKAILFIYPSLYEGFGIPILEAFACGCPVLLSHASCFMEIAGEASEYFDPYDINEITTKVGKILNDEAGRKEMIKKGQDRLQDFSWDRMGQQTINLYQSL